MSNLSCNARSCTNNQGGMCGAGNITIQGVSSQSSLDTYCSNYQDKNYDNGMNSMSNMNYVGQITEGFTSIYDASSNPDVSCNANRCIYNFNNKCEAKQLNIEGDGGAQILGTRCSTYTD